MPPKSPSWPALLSLALFITFASHALPYYLLYDLIRNNASENFLTWIQNDIGVNNFYDLLALIPALLITLSTPKRSGLTLGLKLLREHWLKILLAIAIPILLTALIYPLTSRPFKGSSISMWLISPLAQDLIFVGYIYGLLEQRSTFQPFKKIPINTPLLLTAAFFALWHLPNLTSIAAPYVLFQLAYVFCGTLLTGTTRVLTGSILYITLTHSAINFIAWYTN